MKSYSPNIALGLRSSESGKKSYTMNEAGFYQDISQIENMTIQNRNLPGWDEYTYFPAVQIQNAKSKDFTVENNGVNIRVSITPFSVVVTPDGIWREEDESFNLIAVGKDGAEQIINRFPQADEHSAAGKADSPEGSASDNMEWLGDGYQFLTETEYDGFRMITCEDIEVDQIQSVKLQHL